MSTQRGFTLVEVMIVIAIISILASVAMPAYTDYITRGKLAEVRAALEGQRMKMEQFFQDNRTYVGACASPLAAPGNTKYWTMACVEGATTYTVTAAATAVGPAGFSFSIDETNTRMTVSVGSGWAVPGTNCWVIKKGGVC